MSEPIVGTFHDAHTGETIVRELTEEEIALLSVEQQTLPQVIPDA